MATANFDSILKKVNAYMETSEGKKKKSDAIDKKVKEKGAHTPDRAAMDFINVLRKEIETTPTLGSTAVEALTKLKYTPPIKTNNNQYVIDIFFDGDLSRPSLVPKEHRSYDYDDIRNIAALLNNGYGDENTIQVRGVWHGKKIKSLPQRVGENFIYGAVNRFKNDYQRKYKIIDIRPDDIYK